MGHISNNRELFVGERIDPSMLTTKFFLDQGLKKVNGRIRTPWGTWHSLETHKKRYEFAYSLTENCKEEKILDIACGTGYGAYYYLDNQHWTGVDLSFGAVKHGNTNNKVSEKSQLYVNANGCKLPFPDNSFSTIMSFETMEHIPLKLIPEFLNEIKRVAKPNAQFIVSMPNRDYVSPNHTINTPPVNPYHFFEPNLDEFRGILEPVSKSIQYFYQTGVYFSPKNKIMNKLARQLKILRGEFAQIKNLSDLDYNKEEASVLLAVCELNCQ